MTSGGTSGGGLMMSTSYELRLVVGGPPMAALASANYSARLGVGALIHP